MTSGYNNDCQRPDPSESVAFLQARGLIPGWPEVALERYYWRPQVRYELGEAFDVQRSAHVSITLSSELADLPI